VLRRSRKARSVFATSFSVCTFWIEILGLRLGRINFKPDGSRLCRSVSLLRQPVTPPSASRTLRSTHVNLDLVVVKHMQLTQVGNGGRAIVAGGVTSKEGRGPGKDGGAAEK
jgi:hypothetical protein